MAEGDTPPVKRRAKPITRARRIWMIVGLTLAVLLVAGAAAAGYLTYQTTRSVSEIVREPDALPTGSRPPSAVPSVATAAAPVNILCIGSDKRNPDENGRSDSFIILHISSDRKSAYFISFPRDMWVAIPGHGTAKINAAYSWGGSALAIQTIEGLTGARIDHVVTTDFSDFIGLVDVVGGITVDNPVASASWPKGPVKLNGTSALAFSRQRHELPRGDLDRALRQRAVLKALTLKVASPDVLANPVRLTEVIAAVGKYVTVDSQFTNSAIYDLAVSMRITGASEISMLQAPITGFGTSADGQSIDVVDVAGLTALGKALQTDTMATYLASHPQ